MDECHCIHKDQVIITNSGQCAKCLKPFRHEPQTIYQRNGYKCPACDEFTYKADCTSCGYAKGMNVKQYKAYLGAKHLNQRLRDVGVSAAEAGEALRKAIDLIPKECWQMLDDEIKRRGLK